MRFFLAVLIFPVLLSLSGCWDVEEINRRAVADSIFLDTGTMKPVKIGVSVPVPGTQLPPVDDTAQQFEKRNIMVSGEGDSALDAWTEVQRKMPSDVFFGQIRAIVLSEQAAKGDINDQLEFIGRLPLLPPNTNVLVAKEDPAKLLDLKNETNYLTGIYIDQYFQSPYKRTLALPVDLWRVNSILDKKWEDPYLPMIKTSQDMLNIGGTAVFSEGRMVGELNIGETETLALLRGASAGYLTVPTGSGQIAAFRNIASRNKIEPRIATDGTLTFDVAAIISGALVESRPHQEIRAEEHNRIQKEAKILTKRHIEALLSKLQSLNSDPVGFGGKYRIAYPNQWESNSWHRVYPNAKFNVSTDFRIRSTGLFR